MAAGSAGASWIQAGTAIDNSYFGASMRTCGEVVDELSPGEYLRKSEPQAPPAGGQEGHGR